MELTQLNYFRCVAAMQNMTKASEMLHVTQPTLSKAIYSLESELNVKLFDREGKSLKLNDYGMMVLEYANDVLGKADDLITAINDKLNQGAGQINISFSFYDNAPSQFMEFISGYMDRYPDIRVRKMQQSVPNMLSTIQTGYLDLGFTLFAPNMSGIGFEKLFTERFGFMVLKDSELASRDGVYIEELKDEKFISLSSNYDYSDPLYRFSDEAGFKPNVIYHGTEVDYSIELVTRGRGILLLPKSVFDKECRYNGVDSDILKFVPLLNETMYATPCIIFSEGRYLSTAARLFKDEIVAFFSEYHHRES